MGEAPGGASDAGCHLAFSTRTVAATLLGVMAIASSAF